MNTSANITASAVYQCAKLQFQTDIGFYHNQRKMAYQLKNDKLVEAFTAKINRRVERFNKEHPKGPSYLDLHGMTRERAIEFVKRVVGGLKMKKWLLETGRGNHSPNNEPVIKKTLLEEYGSRIREHAYNKGILIFNLW